MSISILVAGDYVPNRRILPLIEQQNFSFFDEIVPVTSAVDYSIVNLEAPIVIKGDAEPIEKTGPSLKAPKSVVDSLKYAGFDCVTLANNHFRDYGDDGVIATLNCLNNAGISYCGAGRNMQDAKKHLITIIKGKTIAIINCCEHEWSIATDDLGGSNPMDIVEISNSIIEARKNSDYVIVITHGGTEYYHLPSPRMKKTYRFFVDMGADAVINHHQHCFSGYEIYKEKPIFYGLGNFCFDSFFTKTPASWFSGFAVELKLDKIIDFNLYPYDQCADATPHINFINDDTSFQRVIKDYNRIIEDELRLEAEFCKMADGKRRVVTSLLSPYTGILKLLSSKGLLPSFVNKNRKRALLAHTQCESHLDILQYCLKK